MTDQQRDPIVVTGRRRPHEVALLVVSVVLGLTYFIGWAPPPTTVDILVPNWFRPLWYGLLLGSGVVGLAAIWLPDIRTGLLLERVAMFTSTPALVIYIVPIFVVAGRAGLGAGAFLTFWAAANLWRGAQINRDLDRIRSRA
jgi:hypothetical protein